MKFVLRYPIYAVVALSTLCATLPITPNATAAPADEAGGKKTGPVARLIKSKKFQTLLKKVKKEGSLSKINALIKKALGDDSDINREILKNVISSLNSGDSKGKFTKSQLKALKSDINKYINNGGNTPTPPPTPPPGPTPPPESPTQST
jgi:hypothetical protein